MLIVRDAEEAEARDIAYLLNLAGEGIPEYLWRGGVKGKESPLDVGTRRAAREEGVFSYTRARVCTADNRLVGMVLSYRQPDPYGVGDLSEYPEVVRPLVELEAQAPGSWYINAIATFEGHRGKGVARTLLADVEDRARAKLCDRLSLIVASENPGAKRLYEHIGFKPVTSLPVVPYPGCLHAGDWILMIRDLQGA